MKVLIIDDQQDCLNDIFSALQPAGYQFRLSTDPVEAFRLAETSNKELKKEESCQIQ